MPNLVGIGNSQVPTNAMLGGLAYQDPAHANLTNVEIENIAAIKAKLSETAIDIFVYDTRKDSDGGAWRKRTQHTSWYNETLGTDVRGTRKEFPAVAVLVVREVNPAYGLTIYDGDDPNLPMWMDYPKDTTQDPFFDYSDNGSTHIGNYSPTSVSALNGIICVGTYRSAGHISNLNAGLREFHFIEDECYATNNDKTVKFPTRIVDRSVPTPKYYQHTNNSIVNVNVLDVAMTVLPNARINQSSGLPTPTIAVATAGGVSIIKEDGSIVDITSGTIIHHEPRNIAFLGDRLLWTEGNNYDNQDRVYLNAEVPTSDTVLSHTGSLPSGYIGYGIGRGATNIFNNLSLFTSLNNEVATRARKFQIAGPDNTIVLGCKHAVNGGLEQIHQNLDSAGDGILNAITTSYNSGWMHGDCQLAVLADTDTTDLTGGNKITNGSDWSGASGSQSSTAPTGWTAGNGATFAVETGNGADGNYIRLYNENNGGAGPNSYMYQSFTTVVGKTYNFSLTQIHRATITVYVRIGGSINVSSYSASQSWTSSSSNTPRRIVGTFTATTTTTYISLGIISGTHNYTVGWDDVVVTEADENRSAVTQTTGENNRVNDLHAYGTITKTAVANGAELVSYNFPATSSYFTMTHDTNIVHIGSNNFNVMGWFYNTPRGVTFFDIAASASPRFFVAQMYNSDNFWFYMNTGSGSGNWVTGGSGVELVSHWQFIAVKRVGTTFSYSFNGRNWVSQSSSAWGGSITGNVPFITLGQNYTHGSDHFGTTGQMALWRFSHSDISIKQVRKIYDDEKKLFVPNAKCTLYGSSDAVTAISYDDSTGTVHAGTSAGRSEFVGLNRINNTTTAITTSISASDGLVAEQ